MLLEGLPGFSEITVAEAHRGGGREDLEANLALLPEAIHTQGYQGRNGPGQQQVLGALDTLRQLAACPGKEKNQGG